jgi:hypothetical protein
MYFNYISVRNFILNGTTVSLSLSLSRSANCDGRAGGSVRFEERIPLFGPMF